MNEMNRQTCREALLARRQELIDMTEYDVLDDDSRQSVVQYVAAIDAALAALDAPPKPQPPAQPTMPDDIKDDIGLCAAGIVLAYYRKTHDHILRDDDALNAALRVEKWLGRR